MFKFIENKSFFYFSAMVSFVITLNKFYSRYMNFRYAVTTIIILVILLAMMILYNYNHKEIMKVLLASFITIVLMDRLEYIHQIFTNIRELLMTYDLSFDKIRNTITTTSTSIITIILAMLFLNHFILNYDGKDSKIIINVNKVLVMILVISFIVDIVSVFVVYGMLDNRPSKVFHIQLIKNIYPLMYCLTIVSVEAFINNRRAEKVIAVESKVTKSGKSKKNNNVKKKSKKK